jgi:hypothetical protein
VTAACAAAALLAAGCLDDPPTFAPRGQLPPFVLAGQVDPPLSSIYEGPSRFDVSVPFRSEDVNIDLDARLYLDLMPGTSQFPADVGIVIPAGNYEELRSVDMEWTRPLSGCHSLTLILTYVGNYEIGGLPIDDSLAARVVWWLNIGDTDGLTRMATCPGANPVDAVPSPR